MGLCELQSMLCKKLLLTDSALKTEPSSHLCYLISVLHGLTSEFLPQNLEAKGRQDNGVPYLSLTDLGHVPDSASI